MIQDSGARREFETGAVRDIQEGKGRCDLMPLSTVSAVLYNDSFISLLAEFMKTKDPDCLVNAAMKLMYNCEPSPYSNPYTALLELSKHFEEGAKKYGERNWEKGIPLHCFIDSAIRHYLKYRRGDSDEPHDRAALWNVVCAHWTATNISGSLDDIPDLV